jgi:hypothetical protein
MKCTCDMGWRYLNMPHLSEYIFVDNLSMRDLNTRRYEFIRSVYPADLLCPRLLDKIFTWLQSSMHSVTAEIHTKHKNLVNCNFLFDFKYLHVDKTICVCNVYLWFRNCWLYNVHFLRSTRPRTLHQRGASSWQKIFFTSFARMCGNCTVPLSYSPWMKSSSRQEKLLMWMKRHWQQITSDFSWRNPGKNYV